MQPQPAAADERKRAAVICLKRPSLRLAQPRLALLWNELIMSDRASRHAAPRIEQWVPELKRIISTSEPIPHLAGGFGGPLGPAEGPLRG